MAEQPKELIHAESIDSFLKSIREAQPIDDYTFYAHDILAKALVDQLRVEGELYAIGRKVSESVQLDGQSYMATLIETGVPIRNGQVYGGLRMEREPLTRPQKGTYRVDVAGWGIHGGLDSEWMGERTDKINRRGRRVEGKLKTANFTDALSKAPWVKQALLEMRKNSRGGFDG